MRQALLKPAHNKYFTIMMVTIIVIIIMTLIKMM